MTGHAIEYFGMRGCIAILTLNNDNKNQSKNKNSQTFFRNSVALLLLDLLFFVGCCCYFEYPCADSNIQHT